MTSFFASETPVAGATTALGADVAHHVRVRRLEAGTAVKLTDGLGTVGWGTIVRIAKQSVAVDVERVAFVEPAPPVHLIVPIADRDRMLWLAEKSAELGLTSWRPLLWRRSRSVSPRGQGSMFQAKVRARMVSALEQSGGAWLPALYPDATVERAIASAPPERKLLLDQDGEPILGGVLEGVLTVAVGPEGGIEPDERAAFVSAGWTPVSLGGNVLRFETAALAALAIVRAALHRDPAAAAIGSRHATPTGTGSAGRSSDGVTNDD